LRSISRRLLSIDQRAVREEAEQQEHLEKTPLYLVDSERVVGIDVE
jgi:hypothetical protein